MREYTHRNLHIRAAEYYRSIRGEGEPHTLDDIEPQICEFDHLVTAGEFDGAAVVINEIGSTYLALWGFLERVVEMRSRIKAGISDLRLHAVNLLLLSDTYRMMGRIDEAIICGESALKVAEEIGEEAILSQAFCILGGTYRRAGQTDKSIEYLYRALGLAKSSSSMDVALQASHQLGMALTFVGKMEEARRILGDALVLAVSARNIKMQGDIRGQLGYANLWLGNVEAAMVSFLDALENSGTAGNRRGQGYWNLALGEGYLAQLQLVRAGEHFQSAIQIANEISDKHLLSFACSFLGQSLLYEGELERALSSISVARASDNPQHDDYVAMLQGVVLARLGRASEARRAVEESLSLGQALLQKSPDLLEGRCTQAMCLLVLALLESSKALSMRFLVQSRNSFVSAFQDTAAEGVIYRYRRIVEELRALDQSGIIDVAFETSSSLRHYIERSGMFIELLVDDFDIAIDFYSMIGFVVAYENRQKDAYLTMRRGRTILSFFGGREGTHAHPYFSQPPATVPFGYGLEIVVPIDDIEQAYGDIRAVVPPEALTEGLTLRPWGKQDFRLVDPFGYHIRVTEPMDRLKHN